MATEIDGIVRSLRGANDVTQAYASVDRLNREGRTSELVELWAAIEKACDVKGAERFSYEALADHVEEVLALSADTDRVDALFGLLARDRVRSLQTPRSRAERIRAAASRLGHGGSRETLLATIARAGDRRENEEILACWTQELVLRGASLSGDDVAVRFRDRLSAQRHPLAALPLALLDSETEAPTYMPLYGASAISTAVAALEEGPTSMRTMPPPGAGEAPSATPIADETHERALREAVRPWLDGSNGKAEARIFKLSPAARSAGSWLLRALGLASLEGATKIRVDRVGAEAAWGALFAAAANGGAYGSGLGGAYGRLAAWTTTAALIDAPLDAPPSRVDAEARRASFLMFGADGGWFYDVAWDLGVAALRPGGESVAVLAATDTD